MQPSELSGGDVAHLCAIEKIGAPLNRNLDFSTLHDGGDRKRHCGAVQQRRFGLCQVLILNHLRGRALAIDIVSCRYRPSYPPEVFELLRSEGVTTDHLVADIGAGTGIFTRMLVDQGFRVVAVEPNDEMRKGTLLGLPYFVLSPRPAQLPHMVQRPRRRSRLN